MGLVNISFLFSYRDLRLFILFWLALWAHYSKMMSFSKLNITDIDNITDEF